jgi:hypothetical protein
MPSVFPVPMNVARGRRVMNIFFVGGGGGGGGGGKLNVWFVV